MRARGRSDRTGDGNETPAIGERKVEVDQDGREEKDGAKENVDARDEEGVDGSPKSATERCR